MISDWIATATKSESHPSTPKETSRPKTSENSVEKVATPDNYSHQENLPELISKLSEEARNSIFLLGKVNYATEYSGLLR
jgi:hypothetical protein